MVVFILSIQAMFHLLQDYNNIKNSALALKVFQQLNSYLYLMSQTSHTKKV